MKYRNPFGDQAKKPMYDRTGCPVVKSKCGRGCIVTVHQSQWDYLVNGQLVAQRAGRNMEVLDGLIACVLDGKKPANFSEERAVSIYERQTA